MAEPSSSSTSGNYARVGANAHMFVFVTVAIDMMGFGIIGPIMPRLFSELVYGPEAVAAASPELLRDMKANVTVWTGYLAAAYAVVNFICQPILGNLADRYGRRPVLLLSMAMLGVDYLIMGFAPTIWVLFIGRVLAGISGATFSTASAYIADCTPPEKRAQAFGILGAAFGLGFILGPAIGGLLASFGTHAPFFAAAALSGVNFLYGVFVLPESLRPENRRKFEWKRANAFGAFQHFRKIPHLAWFIMAMGLFYFSHWVYPATFSAYTQIRYGWDEAMTGIALTCVGIGSAIVQGGLIGWAMKKFGPTRAAVFGFIMSAIVYALSAFATEGWMMFVLIGIGATAGVLGPAMNSIMTQRVAANAQGELQGAIGGVQALANIFSPFLMTQTLSHFTVPGAPVQFAGASFLLATGFCLLALIPLAKGFKVAPKLAEAPQQPVQTVPAD